MLNPEPTSRLNCAGSFGSLKSLDKRSNKEFFHIDLGFLTILQLAFVGNTRGSEIRGGILCNRARKWSSRGFIF
jgi:hypothetical protein